MIYQNVKHSVNIAGHATSITLEAPFWDAFKEISAARQISINALITQIDDNRQSANLSSAIRIYILAYYKQDRKEHDAE